MNTSERDSIFSAGSAHDAQDDSTQSQVDYGSPFVDQWMKDIVGEKGQKKRSQSEDRSTDLPETSQRVQTASIIFDQIRIQQELSQDTSREIHEELPAFGDEVGGLLDRPHSSATLANAPWFPMVGDTLGGFSLLAELGRGAMGRIFLASQSTLADRPIVLKVTPRDGHEHLSLARLQHTNIVPLFAVEDFEEQGLRVLCMPYVGGASLSQLLKSLRQQPPRQRTGRDLVQALDQIQSSYPIALPAKGPARQFFARATYTQAVCWIGACLADALQYAHERGLVHLDLKPANVLLSADAQPMLLDFHLARGPLKAGEPAPDWLGGTPNFMSPEQRVALQALRTGARVTTDVDGRSDIYSLGLLLREALSPTRAQTTEDTAPLHTLNPQVSVGLSDIIDKCLARHPRDRYSTAATLAEDLRRHLSDLSLRGVANRSLKERWHKWRQRRPQALGLAGMALAILLTVATAAALAWRHVQQRLNLAEEALVTGQKQIDERDYTRASQTFAQGLATAKDTIGGSTLTSVLEARLSLAKRGRAAEELHNAAERIRFSIDPDALSQHELRNLDATCRILWEARTSILEVRHASLGVDLEDRLRTDLLDLAILWANLRVRMAPDVKKSDARREALQMLGEAQVAFGPSPMLYRERHAYAEMLGASELAQIGPLPINTSSMPSAWDHYTLGRFLLRSSQLNQAAIELEHSLNLQPRNFWPTFYYGICTYRLQRYQDAITAFTACVALEPQCASCFYNRALAEAAIAQKDRALRDYSLALQHDSRLSSAALNRGILLMREQRLIEAVADFQRALEGGADPATVFYNLALAYLAQDNRETARAYLERALIHKPDHREAHDLRDRLKH